jgi:hypothetical protein
MTHACNGVNLKLNLVETFRFQSAKVSPEIVQCMHGTTHMCRKNMIAYLSNIAQGCA